MKPQPQKPSHSSHSHSHSHPLPPPLTIPPFAPPPIAHIPPHKQIDSRWNQLKMQNPFPPRQAFAFCSSGSIGYVHGGYNCDDGVLADMYIGGFEEGNRQWVKVASGKDGKAKGKGKGDQAEDEGPGRLRYHSLSLYGGYLVCVGGQRLDPQTNGEVFAFDLRNYRWKKVQIVPQSSNLKQQQLKLLLSRDSHSASINDKKLYIFGGYLISNGQCTNSMLEIDLSNIESDNQAVAKKIQIAKQKNGLVPCPRANFASCVMDKYIYIFGGTNSQEFYDDFWRFNFEDLSWANLTKKGEKIYWPQKRKGAVLVPYKEHQSLILFGGMQNITRQQNDLSIYLINKEGWVKVHSFTNNIYDPSPTIKQQVQNSPTIINHKRKNERKSLQKADNKNVFRIGLVNANGQNGPISLQKKSFSSQKDSKFTTKSDFNHKACKTQMSFSHHHNEIEQNSHIPGLARKQTEGKMSVVQQKRYRQFLARKKKLLSQITVSSQVHQTRQFSPISQCLNYTINQLGPQPPFPPPSFSPVHTSHPSSFSNSHPQSHPNPNPFSATGPQFQLPKVIFDQKKSLVIGKKPCARDGHAAFAYGNQMYIIGGDRHMVSFNDVHLFRMDKAMETIKYYQ